jgi:hypothetical protein
MFRFYKNYLDDQRIRNKKKGKSFVDQQGALNYDLAIALTKHSDYLLALEQEKIWVADKNPSQTPLKLANKATPKGCDNDSIDIGKMLDEW